MKATSLNKRVFPLSFTFLALLSYSALANNDELIAAGEQQAMVCKACHQFEKWRKCLWGCLFGA
ncbi:hypothetical protein DX888_10805 [Vibrio alginolyticus]|nr:hypothetical protein AL541_05080 [Vibrio alginolyticus]EGR2551140.1 hypothetical protein [Vibrio alginolyticus]